ncbi:MAG: prolyl oligopeptidase family serine peptidase [bacterium]|nr:prolyl oligopeptidase family serine peptidase [bacterium]
MLLALALAVTAASQDPPAPPIVPREWLAVRRVDTIRSRRPFRTDGVFARHLVDPSADPPKEGDTITGEHGAGTGETVTANENGALGRSFGYGFTELEVEAPTFALARLQGAATLFLDGEARGGDYYALGHRGVPVELTAGVHRIFLTGARSAPSLRFEPVEEGLVFAAWDVTLPHLVAGSEPAGFVGASILNASRVATGPMTVEYGGRGAIAAGRVDVPSGIVPLGSLRVALPLAGDVVAPDTEHVVPVTVRDARGTERLKFELKLGVVAASERQQRTYRSEVDGAAQAFAVLPPHGESEGPMHLALALHGAAVHCWGQAGCYRQSPDFWVVAPNNRRKFGFDFQDWGRRDVYDVLGEALALSGVERSRVFVTGHSMGGHGSWHMVANDADGFAGCGPSAAWESFDTYSGRPTSALSDVWFGADNSSRTLALIDNVRQTPAFIQHGTADTNVPVEHALMMIDALTKAHGTFEVRMQGGAGHGFGNGWLEAFDFFRGKSIPESPATLDFTTADPSVDARHHWLRIEEPLEYGVNARVRGGRATEPDRIELTTTNARMIAIDAGAPEVPGLVVDGTEIALADEPRPLWLERVGEAWRIASTWLYSGMSKD